MPIRRRSLLLCVPILGAAFSISAVPTSQRSGLPDPMVVPTQPSDFARKGVVSGISRFGDRLIAVGPRGLILVSTDASATWKQVASPVSTDLVSVKMLNADSAWAVGHDAVALRTSDGGATWKKVLDGKSVSSLLRDTYSERAKAGDTAAEAQLLEIDRSLAQSATPGVLPSPFLDVWFADTNEGYLVGAFGLVLRTLDGGQQWTPWIDRLDNERRFHLYAVTGDGRDRYIAGEQGLLLRLDPVTKRFVKVPTPYAGSYFGLDVRARRIVAFGLRGNAYAQSGPSANWTKIVTGIDANIVAAINMDDEQLLLVSQSGHVLAVSPDLSKTIALKTTIQGDVLGAVSSASKKITLAQLVGVKTIDIDVSTGKDLLGR